MLTFIEKQLTESALSGKDASAISLMKTWKKMHKNAIPKERINMVIFGYALLPQDGGGILPQLLSSAVNQIGNSYYGTTPEESPKTKMILEILKLLEDANVPLSNLGSRTLHEWSIENNLGILLDHPLVQQELVIKHITELYASGEFGQARELAESIKDDFKLNPKQIFDMIQYQMLSHGSFGTVIPAYAKDAVVIDLIEQRNISPNSLLVLYPMETMPDTIKETDLGQTMNAMLSMEKEFVKGESRLTAIPLIKKYLKSIEDPEHRTMAASELYVFVDQSIKRTLSMPVSDIGSLLSDAESLYVLLLNEGATPSSPMYPLMPGFESYNYPTMFNMQSVILHPQFEDQFKKIPRTHQMQMVRHLLNPDGVAMSQMDAAGIENCEPALRWLSARISPASAKKASYARPLPGMPAEYDGEFLLPMDIVRLPMFNALGIDMHPGKETSTCAILSMLIRNHLIKDLDKEAHLHYLPFPPKDQPGKTYTLYEFIMDHEETRAAWEEVYPAKAAKAESSSPAKQKADQKDAEQLPPTSMVTLHSLTKKRHDARTQQQAASSSSTGESDKPKKGLK